MTCIVGLVDNGQVWLGADSLGSAGYSAVVRKDKKVFRIGGEGPNEVLIAYCGSYRMGQVLRYQFTPPKHPDGMDSHEYMVVYFVDALRATFARAGFQRTENGVDQGGSFLVGYRGRLFGIESDYQVGEPSAPYHAQGAGADVALGSLHTTQNVVWTWGAGELSPEDRLRFALQASEEYNTSVRGPYDFVSGACVECSLAEDAPCCNDMPSGAAIEIGTETMGATASINDESIVMNLQLYASDTERNVPTAEAWAKDPQNPDSPNYVCPDCGEKGKKKCKCGREDKSWVPTSWEPEPLE